MAEHSGVIGADLLDRIARFDAGGVPVVSLYVGIEPGARSEPRSRVTSLLHEVREVAERQADRTAKLSLRGDIERIEEATNAKLWKPGGAAFFSCSEGGLFEQVELPRRVRDRAIVNRTPWIRAMLAVLDEYHRCCVVTVDRKSGRVWELFADAMEEVGHATDAVLRKPNRAGWYGLEEHRNRNKADELAKRHYRRVAEKLDELFRRRGFELLAIGGHAEETPLFLDFLPRPLRERVAGTFVIDPHTATDAEIRAEAEAIVNRYEREQERRLVAEVLAKAGAGGPAAVGLEQCLWAATTAAAQLLLVRQGAVSPGVVCDACGWLALSGEACGLCGGPARPVPDLIEELVEAVIDEGGTVEHAAAGTELDDHLTAASLRFPLPPR